MALCFFIFGEQTSNAGQLSTGQQMKQYEQTKHQVHAAHARLSTDCNEHLLRSTLRHIHLSVTEQHQIPVFYISYDEQRHIIKGKVQRQQSEIYQKERQVCPRPRRKSDESVETR